MISSSREAKQEGGTSETNKLKKATLTPQSSRAWSAYRNPRIVRVSRAFGGKDRHSKVCTIRGLRDRRIRLSVQTAIQLYDLQDRLGLNQPSKVIDWLIDATKDDIDKLPPLPMPPGFGQFQHPMILSHEPNQSHLSSINLPNPFFDVNGIGGFHNSLGIKINGEDQFDMNHAKSRYSWDQETESSALMHMRGSRSGKEIDILGDQKGKWPMRSNDQEQENQENGIPNYNIGGGGQSISAQMFFPMVSSNNTSSTPHSSLPNFLHNSMPFNSPYHHNLDQNSSSNLSLSQFSSHGFATQTENSSPNNNNMSINVLSLPNPSISPGPQLFFCPPMSIPSLFAPYNVNSNSIESESREINHLQLLDNSTAKPFSSLRGKDVDADS